MASSSFPNYPTYPILPTAPPAPPSQSLPVPAGYGSVANYPPGYIYDLTQHRERSNYLSKVYWWLFLELLYSASIVTVLCLWAPARNMFLHTVLSLGRISLVVVTIIPIVFLVSMGCTSPANQGLRRGLLVGFLTSMSALVAVPCTLYYLAGLAQLVVVALVCTVAVFGILSLILVITKADLRFLGKFGISLAVMMLIWGFIALVFGFQTGLLYSLLGAAAFTCLLLADTSRIVKAAETEYIEPLDASVSLYVDVVGLFIFTLRLISGSNN